MNTVPTPLDWHPAYGDETWLMDVWVLTSHSGYSEDHHVVAVYPSLSAAKDSEPGDWKIDGRTDCWTSYRPYRTSGYLILERFAVKEGAKPPPPPIDLAKDARWIAEVVDQPPADLTKVPPIKPNVGG